MIQHISEWQAQANVLQEFQFQYSLPGQQEGARKIPTSVIAKALSWQKTRASNPQDPFFMEFSTEFLQGFQEAMLKLSAQQPWYRRVFSHSNSGPPANSGWMEVPCFPLAIKVIARLTTKSLFGAPLCRSQEFLEKCCQFGDAVPRDAFILRCFPAFTRP